MWMYCYSTDIVSLDTLLIFVILQLMTKTQLAAALAEKLGVSKKMAKDMVEGFVEIVIESVKNGEGVSIQGFGTFKSSARAARTGVNPRNPSEKIEIPAMKVASFKAGSEFKAAVRNS